MKDGAPGGCQSHGSCSTGGCNRMNVHDWLANLPFSDPESNCRVIEVSYNNGSRKDFFKNNTLHFYEKGDMIAVEGISGFDVGMVYHIRFLKISFFTKKARLLSISNISASSGKNCSASMYVSNS